MYSIHRQAERHGTVGNILFLGFWTSSSIPGFSQNNYMTVYACLGLAQGMTSFFVSFSFSLATLVASLGLFKAALNGVLRSSTSFFDATPLGTLAMKCNLRQARAIF
jgi:ATP-binding cassette, subfamily C (CFTR/MRP), member 1